MAFEVEGKLHKIFPGEQRSATFQTRDFVLEVPDGNYPQLIKFQAVQERCGILDAFREGDSVKVSFDLRGREWNGKYLTNLNAWRIDRSGGSTGETPVGAAETANDDHFPSDPFPNYADAPPVNDNLPF